MSEEEDPGRFLGFNNDDDNGDGVPDYQGTGQDGGGVQYERVATAKMIATTVSELDWLGVGETVEVTATVVPSGVNGSGDDNNYLWQQSGGHVLFVVGEEEVSWANGRTVTIIGKTPSPQMDGTYVAARFTTGEDDVGRTITTFYTQEYFTVVGVNLGIAGVGEAQEEDPGKFMGFNNDDDNGNGVPDYQESGPVAGENDLAALSLSYGPPELNVGQVTLMAVSGGSRIKLWTSSNKGTQVSLPASWNLASESVPSTLYVEGVAPSGGVRDVGLKLFYQNQGEAYHEDRAAITVVEVSISEPDEDDVHLKEEEIAFQAEVQPAGLPGAAYGWSVLAGTCDPSNDDTDEFITTLKSLGVIRVRFAITLPTATFDDVRSIETLQPEVTEISWINDHDLAQWPGGTAITDPVWIKSLGEAVTKNEPGAYTKSGQAKAELKIEGSKALSHSTNVQVEGDGNAENFYAQGASFHYWDWSPGELQLNSSPLYGSVNFYDTLDVTWYYRVQTLAGGWGDWVEMNQSSHKLYTTFASPVSPEQAPRVDILDYACHWAVNAQCPDNVCSYMLTNGFAANYTWQGDCYRLSSDFVRVIATVGIAGQQHRWSSRYWHDCYPYGGTPNVGDMGEQRTISFTPVGGIAGSIEWRYHQWAEAVGKQRDPSAAYSHDESWRDYEDYLFTHYRECTSTNPYQTQWVTNQSGQFQGPEHPDHRIYDSNPTIWPWYGPH